MTASLAQLLEELTNREIEFILVGGMAAVIHGAPVTTLDLDIVHSRSPENVNRLLAFLQSIHATHRGQPTGRVLPPQKAGLTGTGHNNFSTDLGPLDVLCELSPGQDYEALLPFTEMASDGIISVRIIGLAKLIEIKLATGRPKDDAMVPLLMKRLHS